MAVEVELTAESLVGGVEHGCCVCRLEIEPRQRMAERQRGGAAAALGRDQRLDRDLAASSSQRWRNQLQARRSLLRARWVPRSANLDDDPDHMRARLEMVIGFVAAAGYPPAFG